MCVGRVQCSIWQAAPPPHMPSGPLYGRQSVGFYMPLCLAKHLQPMSRADRAKCRTKSERTTQHAIMANGKHRLTPESLIGPNEQLKGGGGGGGGVTKDAAVEAAGFSPEEVRRCSVQIESGQEDAALGTLPLIFPSLKVTCPLLRCGYSPT